MREADLTRSIYPDEQSLRVRGCESLSPTLQGGTWIFSQPGVVQLEFSPEIEVYDFW